MTFALWILVVILAAWGVLQLRTYPRVGAAYRAKVLCTGLFGSGRELEGRLWSQVTEDSYWLLRPFRVMIDRDARTVTASLLGFLPRTAIYRDGLGATLLVDRPAVTLGPVPTRRVPVSPSSEWRVSRGPAGLQRIVDAAFEEPDPKRLRRTFAVVVVHDGQIVAERYAPGKHVDMPLPGWSVAKSVLNALTGVLVDEGRLQLDRRELLPQWRGPDPRSEITLEDLLRMRSGLRFSEQYGNPWSNVLRMLYLSHDMAGYAASRPLGAQPGTHWQYSSGTTNILSCITRRAVGEADYHGWPTRALFDRIGMTSAVLEPDPAGTFVCSSYMTATARDWARFGQLYADGGRWRGERILSDNWMRFTTTPSLQSPDGRYGAHWWLKLNEDIGGGSAAARDIAPDALFAVGHEAQTVTVIPSKRLVIVRLGAAIFIDAWNQAELVAGIQDQF